MQSTELELNANQLYEKLIANKVSQRHKRFIIKALREQGFKVRKTQKKWVQRNRGKAPFKPKDLPALFENMQSLSVMMASCLSIVTGCRRAEVIEVKKTNIHFEECRIHLEITKKGVPQDVYFPSSFTPILKKYCHYTRDSPYLFPNRLSKDQPMSPSSLNQELNKAVKKVGLGEIIYVKQNGDQAQKYGFHSFRKFFCSMLVNNGVRPEVARILMRHEKIELTLKVYTQLGKKTLNDAMGLIDPLITQQIERKDHLQAPSTDINSQFASQSIILFNNFITGKITKTEYDAAKGELLALQKIFRESPL